MKILDNTKNKEFNWAFLLVGIIVFFEVLFYIHIGIRGLGTLQFRGYLSIIMAIMMYYSIFKYTIDYFKKSKEASMDGMIFRFGIASLSNLIGLKEGNNVAFVCTAIIVFIAPNMIGHWKTIKKQFVYCAIVFTCTVVIAIVYLIEPTEKLISYMGHWVYVVDTWNQVIQWSLFCLLIIIRAIVIKRDRISAAEHSPI